MNILFLAHEVESPLINELARLYKADISSSNYILNCDFWTFTHQKPDFYSRIYDENNYDFHDSCKEEYKSLNNVKENADVDYDYLSNLEDKYKLSLNAIISTDPILYTVLHGRDYLDIPEPEIKLKWAELIAKKIEKIFKEFKPDLILTVGNNYFVKNITFHMSKHEEIKYLSILNARVLDKYVAFDNLGINTPRIIVEKIKTIGIKNKEEAENLIHSLSNDAVALYSSHNDIISNIAASTFITSALEAFKSSLFSLYVEIFKRNNFKKNHLGNKLFKGLIYTFRNDVFRKTLIKKSSVFAKTIDKKTKYYYMALHVIPESTILTQSEDYNEEAYIIDICRKLPIDTCLIVKENIEMLGMRPLSFYKKLNSIHNLVLVNPFMPSLQLIKGSLGTISVCGTVSLEAALLNKRSIIIGMPEYSFLKGVERYDKYRTSFDADHKFEGTVNDCLLYIQSIIEVGESVDVKFLMGYKCSVDYKSRKFKDEVLVLKKIFDAHKIAGNWDFLNKKL
jgi:hypothetical protein